MNSIAGNSFRRESAMELESKEEVAEFRGTVGSDGCVGVLGRVWEGGDVEGDGWVGGSVPGE